MPYAVVANVEIIIEAEDKAEADIKAKEVLSDFCSDVTIWSINPY